MFAARTLGDRSRWPEMWALNQGRVMDERRHDVERGVAPLGRLGARAARRTTGTTAANRVACTWSTRRPAGRGSLRHRNGDDLDEVRRTRTSTWSSDGDSYWRIAEVTLRVELGAEPTGRRGAGCAPTS